MENQSLSVQYIAKKVDALNDLAWELNRKDPRQAMELSEQALLVSTPAEYRRGMAKALKTLGACNIWISKNEDALSKSIEAIELFKEIGDKKEEAQVNYNIGTNFYYMADYDNSLKYFMQCFKINEGIGNLIGQADGLNGMGTVYYTIEDNEKALDSLLKSRTICNELGDTMILQKVLDGLGTTYNNLKQYDKALESMFKCLELITLHGGTQQVQAFALDGIGSTYARLGEHDKALDYFNQSLKIRNEIGFKVGEAGTLTNIGKLYFDKGDLQNALLFVEKSLALATEINSKEWIYQASEKLSQIYEGTGDSLKAFEYFKQYHLIKEEVRNEDAFKKSKSLELQRKMEQNEIEKQMLIKKNSELESYYNDITILSETGQKITSSLSAEIIIATVYEHINKLMDAPSFGIGVLNNDNETIAFPGYIEKGEKLPSINYSLKDKNRLAVWCIDNREEIFINDFNEEATRYIEILSAPMAGEEVASLIYLPLLAKEKLVGVITVQSFNKNAYTDYHLNILRNLAVYAAIALENAQLYENMEDTVKSRTREVVEQKEEIEKAYQNTRLLSEIGQQLTSTLDFDTIFNKLHGNVNQLMDAGCFGVRIYHPEKNIVEYKFEIEKGSKQPSAIVSMDDDDNFSVWCIKNKKEIFINDNLAEYSKYTNKIRVVSGDMPHSLIFYPLMLGERVLGVITIQSFHKNAYTKYHLDILKTLASYTAIALDNANLYESMEEKVRERTAEVILQKEIIEEKSQEITDSISYAKRIQQAILPLSKNIMKALPHSFRLYMPKNLVSGDFYWFVEKDNKILVAAVDCTGHGVPGAFMSMLGSNLLDFIVVEKGVTNPAEILRLLNAGVKSTLKQNEQDSESRDGMDIALCIIDKENNSLEFAGANRALYHFRNGTLCELPPTKSAIGGLTKDDQEFKYNQIGLQQGDSIYIFTDGFADQFGGGDGKKFMSKRFRELLYSIQDKTMAEQEIILTKTFFDWKGNCEQVDDILVIGIRI